MKKRILSIIVCLTMVITTFAVNPLMASATVESETPDRAVNYTNAAPIVSQDEEEPAVASLFSLRRTAGAIAPTLIEGNTPDGLSMDKSATVNEDGSYTINLEAYSTGTVTKVDTTKPTDIILVIDQSGSMSYDFDSSTYTAVYEDTITENGNYYIKDGSAYRELEWCNTCNAWTIGCQYYYDWSGRVHYRAGTKYEPKTSSTDTATSHTQFYTVSNSSSNETRLDCLVEAVNGFVGNVVTKSKGENLEATSDDVDHRIAIVGFSSSGYNNTELLTGVEISKANVNSLKQSNGTYYYPHNSDTQGAGRNGVQYGNITDTQYGNALQSVNTTTGLNSVNNAIDALTAHGGTQTYDGLDMASEIFANTSANIVDENNEVVGTRNRVVILFTDGDTNSDRANTVDKAYQLKDTYNATVYTVGIFENANGEPPVKTNTSTANKFMHYISSNYPDAQSGNRWDSNPGSLAELKDGESYYLSAGDADALNNIFQKISQQLGSSTIDLGSTAVVKDIVSPYFTLPNNATDVTAKSYDCLTYNEETKEATWSETGTSIASDNITINSAERSVSVTGFDFSKNFVSQDGRDENDSTKEGNFRGRKLVISFNVSVRDGFWGGNNVPTNGTASGIYPDSNPATEATGTFRVPTVNVPIDYPAPTAANKNIYYKGTTPNASDLCNFKVPSGDDAWKVEFVNISYPAFSDDNQVISDSVDTTDIGVKVSVSPKYSGDGADAGTAATAVEKECKSNVYVFKPEITYKDSETYYGDTVPAFESNNYVSTVWKHEGTKSTDVTMFGDEPTIIYQYTVPNGCIDAKNIAVTREGIPVDVTAKIGDADLEEFLVHKPCSPACDYNAEESDFLVHINTCNLTITKSGVLPVDDDTNDTSVKADDAEYQTTLFDVYKLVDGEQEYVTTVAIKANGSTTVAGLPVGTYAVVEKESWNWRYSVDTQNSVTQAVLSSTSDTGTAKFANNRDKTKWLNGGAYNENKFNAVGSN